MRFSGVTLTSRGTAFVTKKDISNTWKSTPLRFVFSIIIFSTWVCFVIVKLISISFAPPKHLNFVLLEFSDAHDYLIFCYTVMRMARCQKCNKHFLLFKLNLRTLICLLRECATFRRAARLSETINKKTIRSTNESSACFKDSAHLLVNVG